MIKVNEYFDGKVKSIGHELKGQTFTIGIMESGEYTFGTSSEEHMEIIFGEMEVTLPDGTTGIYKKGESFVVAADREFSIKVSEPVSYICLYK